MEKVPKFYGFHPFFSRNKQIGSSTRYYNPNFQANSNTVKQENWYHNKILYS